MNLDAALTDMQDRFNLSGDLITFAAEDTYSGFDGGEGTFPGGSLWTVEGQVLYALTRALKARRVCELGTLHGASATHLAAAIVANGTGQVDCIDPWEGAGTLIAPEVRVVCRLTFTRGEVWLSQQKNKSLSLIFEDGLHDEDTIEKVGNLAKSKLRPGGMLVSHDAAHATAGEHVCEGLRRTGLDFTVYAIEPSDCGLAIWQRSL